MLGAVGARHIVEMLFNNQLCWRMTGADESTRAHISSRTCWMHLLWCTMAYPQSPDTRKERKRVGANDTRTPRDRINDWWHHFWSPVCVRSSISAGSDLLTSHLSVKETRAYVRQHVDPKQWFDRWTVTPWPDEYVQSFNHRYRVSWNTHRHTRRGKNVSPA